LSESQRSKKKVLRILLHTSRKVRTLDRDFPITQIAWMSLNGELSSIGDPSFQRDLMSTSRKANEYRRRYWRLEEAIKQDFVHRMSKMKFSPSFSPEIETLRNNLPGSVLKEDGRLWTYSYDYYIKEIANKVGRDPSQAPAGDEEFRYYSDRFRRERTALHAEALSLLNELSAFIASLKDCIRNDSAWTGIVARKVPVGRIEGRKPLIILKRPFPLPKVKRPRKGIFRRLKRQTIGPEGPG
jgi:hypothetical protein